MVFVCLQLNDDSASESEVKEDDDLTSSRWELGTDTVDLRDDLFSSEKNVPYLSKTFNYKRVISDQTDVLAIGLILLAEKFFTMLS